MPPVELPFRTERVFGRQTLLDRLRTLLTPESHGPARVVSLIGEGGTGKTRLLEAIGEELRSAGRVHLPLYDFYHIDRFRASAIEDAIIAALTAQRPAAAEAFAPYQQERKELERARQRGVGFEPAQDRVRTTFVACYNAFLAAQQGPPAVLLFDTVEQAVNLSDGAEQHFLDDSPGASAGGESWLSEILPNLQHTVVILSGRPQTLYGGPVQFVERLAVGGETLAVEGLDADASAELARALQAQLTAADQPEEIREFAASVDLDPATLAVWYAISGGMPFWTAMLFTCVMFGAVPPGVDGLQRAQGANPGLTVDEERRRELRGEVTRHLLVELNATDQHLVLALQWMATMRRGASPAMLGAVAATEGIDVGDPALLAQRISRLLVVKQRIVPRYTDFGEGREETLLFLHDELYHWLDQDTPGAVVLRPAVSRALLRWYDEAIGSAERRRLEAVGRLLTVGETHAEAPGLQARRDRATARTNALTLDRLGYLYQLDMRRGVREYNALAYLAILNRNSGYGVMLRQEALRNHYRLGGGVPFAVEVECAARWLLRAVHNENQEAALRMVERADYYLSREPEHPGPHYALLYDAITTVLLRYKQDQIELIERSIGQARELAGLTGQSTVLQPSADTWLSMLQVRICYHLAFLYRLRYDLFAAVAQYRLADFLLLRDHTFYGSIAGTTAQNLAYAYSEQGDAEYARRYGLMSLRLNEEHGGDYNVALSLNTLARIEIRAGQPFLALEYARKARTIFEEFKSDRGLSLCMPVLAEAHRKVAELYTHSISDQERHFADAVRTLEEAEALYRAAGIVAAERWRELYQTRGCAYRSWGQVVFLRGVEPERADAYFAEATRWLGEALAVARRAQPPLVQMDILEDMATVLINQDVYDGRVVAHLDEAERLAPQEYRYEPGVGLRGVREPVYAYWRELGQCQLQRMMVGFGAYFDGYYELGPDGERQLRRQGQSDDLRAAARHMLLMLAYLLHYAHSSAMLDRAIHLTVRELLQLREEQELKLIAQEFFRTAREYRLVDSEAYRLAERLIDQTHADRGFGTRRPAGGT